MVKIQHIGQMILATEKEYAMNFMEQHKKLFLSLHWNAVNNYLFVNSVEIYKFKAEDSEIKANLLCLSNISNNFSVGNIEMTGFSGYIYNFPVD